MLVQLNPFVSSIIPVIQLTEISLGIPILYKRIDNILKIPEVSSIDKITEKKTINPPIERIEVIDFFMALPRTSPISETFKGVSLELNLFSLKLISNLSFFQNLKQYPYS